MRNQIKKMINKEEGFTLVELLAVLVILGIIVAIAIPAIGNIVDGAEEDAQEAEEELVIDAARLYDIENDFPAEGVTVQELIDGDFLEGLSDNSQISDTAKVTYDDSTKKYAVE